MEIPDPKEAVPVEFEFLARGMFTHDRIHVHYDTTNNFNTNRIGREIIEREWNLRIAEARQKGTILFDGQLFRLAGFQLDRDELRLDLGNTRYKEYIGTRIPAFAATRPLWSLANPLAVCMALLTADHKIILERRPSRVDVYPGSFHVIGGFMDRNSDFAHDKVPSPFAAIKREVHEELGLSFSDSYPTCLGLVYDRRTPHPELCFWAQVGISSDRIRNIFSLAEQKEEAGELCFQDGSEEELAKFIVTNHANISVTGEACLALLGTHWYGEQFLARLMTALNSS